MEKSEEDSSVWMCAVQRAVPCGACARECERARPAQCAHACARRACHPGACPPCELLVRCACHCGLQQLLVECCKLGAASLCCGSSCYKTMECGHRCVWTCHAGACSPASQCARLVKLPCRCGTVKAELPCSEAKTSKTECNEVCERKRLAAEEAASKEEMQRRMLEEERNRKELEDYERKFRKGRSRKRERDTKMQPAPRSYVVKNCVAAFLVLASVIAAYYFTN